jgi:hypothetical protein
MKSLIRTPLGALLLTIAIGPSLHAADLFSETFDDELAARIATNNGTAGTVAYVDYSLLTIGAIQHQIPEAPRRIPGSLPAKGALLKINYAGGAASERIVNLVALQSPGGERLFLTDNYRLRFDCYQRLSPNVTLNAGGFPNEVGTTEQMLWGVGYNATSPMGRGWRSGRGNGTWGWLATEGGFGATTGSDASLYVNGGLIGGRDLNPASADFATYWIPAFGNTASPIPGAPANQWVEADITVLGGQVTVQYKGATGTATKFFQNVNGSTGGTVMVGYEDAATSVSFDPDNQWMLVDNMIVEDLTPPTLVVAPAQPLSTWTGSPVSFSYTITNGRTNGPLTVSAVNFTGANAADFRPETPLPLVIPQGQSATLSLLFDPKTGANGVRTASMTIVSDDPQAPAYEITGLAARRSGALFLAAHYRLDETSGNTFADSSGNGFPGGAQVREPLGFGQPSLLGTGSSGTATGFLPAQASNLGCYFASNVTNTPSFTVSLWMRPAAAGNIRTLFQRDPDFDSVQDEICALVLDASGRLVYRVASADVLTSDVLPEPIADGSVYHVAVTHLDTDGFGNAMAKRSRLYVNGRLISETTGNESPGFDDYPINPTVGALHVASRTVAGHGFAGELDDVQIYGTELSREQIWGIFRGAGRTADHDWQISRIAPDLGGTMAIEFPSSPDGRYQLFRSGSLSGWAPLGAPFSGSSGPDTAIIDLAPPPGQAFYRIQRE